MTPRRPRGSEWAAAGYVLAVTLAILATLLLIHWAECGQATGTALCTGPLLVRMSHGRWRWLDRIACALRGLCVRTQLAWEESALDSMTEAHAMLPDEIRRQRALVESLRIEAVVLANAARGEA
jgi:hypothetical protein